MVNTMAVSVIVGMVVDSRFNDVVDVVVSSLLDATVEATVDVVIFGSVVVVD